LNFNFTLEKLLVPNGSRVIPPPGLQIYLLPSVTLTLGRLSPGLQICLLFSVTLSFGLLCASCYDTVSIYSNMYVPELLKMRQTVQCTLVLVSFLERLCRCSGHSSWCCCPWHILNPSLAVLKSSKRFCLIIIWSGLILSALQAVPSAADIVAVPSAADIVVSGFVTKCKQTQTEPQMLLTY